MRDSHRSTSKKPLSAICLAQPVSIVFRVAGPLLSAILIVSCRSPSPTTSDIVHQQSQRTEARALNADEESCKAVVQKFYDWYWNRFADQAEKPGFNLQRLPSAEDVLRLKPPVLDRALQQLLQNEEDEMRRTHEIGNLDFDPFLNTQDAQGEYTVNGVDVTKDRCAVRIERGHLTAELEKVGTSWIFTNFDYRFVSEDGKQIAPDDNLVHILTVKQ